MTNSSQAGPYHLPDVLPFEPIAAGNLQVRLAKTAEEVETSQRLRYRIFCGEMGGKASPEIQAQQRDFDKYDNVCDHLLVLDMEKTTTAEQVVGTYRLIRREAAEKIGGFYTESEYDVSKIKNYDGNVLELGRSCVEKEYRNRAVMTLLWRGIGAYASHYNIDLMFGCASFTGDDPKRHAQALSYLYHNHLAPENLRARSLDKLYVDMNMIPAEELDTKAALSELPPLIKGYLRLGGYIGDGAVLDHDYNTTDVCICVQTDLVTEKYYQRYAQGGSDSTA